MQFFKKLQLNTPPTIADYKNKTPYKNRLEFGLRIKLNSRKQTTTNDPLLSVITIVRNGEKCIERTIQSVLSQSYKNIEYIIIDGGSTDNTLNIIQKYEDKIDYCLSEPDKGISDAFNKGIALSSGELIGIINSDDWYESNAFEIILKEYLNNKESIFHGNLRNWDNNEYLYVSSANHRKLNYFMSVNHPTVFVPKSVYEKIGLFNLSFKIAMDYDWLRRCTIAGENFYYIDTIISNMNLNGLSEAQWPKAFYECFLIRYYQKMNLLINLCILIKSMTFTATRKIFEKIKFTSVIFFYRKKISSIKKIY